MSEIKVKAINFFQSPPPGMNPDSYAIKFAEQNNISVEEAKVKLRQMLGEPSPQPANKTKDQDAVNGTDKVLAGKREDFDKLLVSKGIPAELVDAHNRVKIEEYAKENNIQLPPPPDGTKLTMFA